MPKDTSGEHPRRTNSRPSKMQMKLNDPSEMRRCNKCKGTFSDSEQCPACNGYGGINLRNI